MPDSNRTERPRLLIEDWLPAAAIGVECIRERSTLCANDDETKHPVKFRLWVSRRMSRGDAESGRGDDSRRG